MPTENRSSNTEMVSVQATIESLEEAYAGDSALDFMNDAAQLLRQFKAISTPQPHPDPVALPERKEVVEEWATPGGPYRAEGWNACLDEIANLGPLYTHPAPADPGEVERLRASEDKWHQECVNLTVECEALRAQLAERDALLREKSGDLIRMAAHLISAPLFALQDLQDEDKKMTRARVDHAVDVADARLKDAAYELRRIADALSASADPSTCQRCAGTGIWYPATGSNERQQCPEGCAPVERDERTEFEACIRREWPMAPISRKRDLLPKDDPCYGDYCDEPLQRAWVGWQMRAALERNPS